MWTSLLAYVLAGAAWVGSLRRPLTLSTQYGEIVSLRAGVVSCMWISAERRGNISRELRLPLRRQWFRTIAHDPVSTNWSVKLYFVSADGHMQMVFLPLWMLLILTGASAAALRFWTHRMTPPGHCRRCGYDLAGLSERAACPECGASRSRRARRPRRAE
jgi:hypothetical protein